MTTLEQLNLSQPLTDVYTAMETDLMMAIARQLAKDGEISATSEWRLKKLAEAGALSKETIKIIASYTGIQSDLLTETIESAAIGVTDKLEPALQAVARDGLISEVTSTPISAGMKKVVGSFRTQAKTDLNLVNTVMQYKAKSSYTNLVNKIYNEANKQELLSTLGKHTLSVASGATSRQEAVRNCIKEFSQKGIPAFVDKAGREWSPEAYINMDIRTTVNNTAHAAQDACCDKYGIDLFQVSSHMGARPKCAPYQGKLVSRSDLNGIAHDGDGNPIPFIPLSETSYGEPDGLFGINCHHKKYPFIDGVNFQRYFPYDEEENAQRYKEFQHQRHLERRVRETSRQVDMLNEIGDTEGAKEARRKLTQQRKAYRDYSDSHGLAQHNDRLTVTRVRKGDNVFPEIHKKPLDNGGGSGIMKQIPQAKTAEEAHKMLVDVAGFGKVEDSFKTLNPELSVAATNQLIKLENSFGAIAKSTNTTIFAEDAPGAGAFVRRATYCNPAEQRLSLCPKAFGLSKQDFEALVREKRDKKWFMPFSDGEESEYLVTHEYGHMIQNILVQQRMIQKGLDLSTPEMFVDIAKLSSSNKKIREQAYAWYINLENEVADECFSEILDIAKTRNPNFVFAHAISKYGGTGNKKEFFAETFANSQLGDPNELGEAMKIWLERKGLAKK